MRSPIGRPTASAGADRPARRSGYARRCVDSGFLQVAELSADVQRLYDDDVEQVGYVMNVSKLWAYQHHALGETAPASVRDAVTFGRTIGAGEV